MAARMARGGAPCMGTSGVLLFGSRVTDSVGIRPLSQTTTSSVPRQI